jgi:hypothetical protein
MNRTDAKQAREIANTVLSSFDELTGTYVKLFRMCYDALGPDAPQTERNRVRHALDKYFAAKDGRPPPK